MTIRVVMSREAVLGNRKCNIFVLSQIFWVVLPLRFELKTGENTTWNVTARPLFRTSAAALEGGLRVYKGSLLSGRSSASADEDDGDAGARSVLCVTFTAGCGADGVRVKPQSSRFEKDYLLGNYESSYTKSPHGTPPRATDFPPRFYDSVSLHQPTNAIRIYSTKTAL